MSQPLTPEKWEHLKEKYGDDTYLMIYSQITALCATNFPSNEMIEIRLHNPDYATLMLKKSAALPFDLERAKAGDEFECFYGSQWYSVFYEDVTFYELGLDLEQNWMLESGENLRMKHPPKSTNNKPTTTGEPPC
jgi:hypothetical protein